MTRFFLKFKKPYLWNTLGPLPQFWGKKRFPEKSGSVRHNLIRVSNTMPIFRET